MIQKTDGMSLSLPYFTLGGPGVALGEARMPGTLRGLCVVVDGGAGENPEIGIELVVGLGGIFQIEAVADRLVADVARKTPRLASRGA